MCLIWQRKNIKRSRNSLSFESNRVKPRIFGGFYEAHYFGFLCFFLLLFDFVLYLVCQMSFFDIWLLITYLMSLNIFCQYLWIVHFLLPLRVSVTFTYLQSFLNSWWYVSFPLLTPFSNVIACMFGLIISLTLCLFKSLAITQRNITL